MNEWMNVRLHNNIIYMLPVCSRDFSVTWYRPSYLLALIQWQRSYSGGNSSSLIKTRWRILWIMGKTLLFQAEYRPVTPGGVILFLEISFNSMDALARLLTADANSDSGKWKQTVTRSKKRVLVPVFGMMGFSLPVNRQAMLCSLAL